MKKFIQQKLKDQKGMTLIELLAVIVIIAIIAAIAIPAIGNIIENSRVGAAKSDALSAFAAAELYLAENAADTAITTAELTGGGYLDDLGSFPTATGPAFAVNTAGDLLLTGTAVNGGVTVAFSSATKGNVQDLNNSADSAAGASVAPSANITVTR
ncbi:prepilin-type N-terminal cleavage/methylation domain-containing protein [Planococcus sp. APC 3906]|uniref:prepilin-type N-terminal cleavage/methylation domain-containing protein n=1 Tax=Planococcus sp. APC 3906 TaxID=3035194 RepID=UPI0025B5006E|nr:prepilin-type N-terminal cleavage/methylation domain-containing protein [Planococcus sp. APC 3906]MDN3449176.1 prepilin-type N-terminal cleavage/methylation domain-containing protein [Planococcus sp. APC 3906]